MTHSLHSGITTTQFDILASVTDDRENLEQLYRSLCLEFSAAQYRPSDPTAFYWRAGTGRPTLADLVRDIRHLLASGYMDARMEDGRMADRQTDDVLWEGWFGLTPAGRQYIDALA